MNRTVILPGKSRDHEKNSNEKEDSDVEGGDRDSDDSDQSGSGSGYSSEGSESDEVTVELDEEECMKRRQACIEQMTELEKQIVGLRDQIINEQLYQIELKLNEIKCGEAPEYLQPLADLEENARIRNEVAVILRQLKIKNLENEFEAEELAAKQNFENEKVLLYDSVEEDLKQKIKNLEEDKNNVDLNADLWMVERGLSKAGKMTKDKKHSGHVKGGIYREFDSNPRRKPITVSGPYIVYMLRDSEILEDWTVIKKALSNYNRKPDCTWF